MLTKKLEFNFLWKEVTFALNVYEDSSTDHKCQNKIFRWWTWIFLLRSNIADVIFSLKAKHDVIVWIMNLWLENAQPLKKQT